MPTALVVGGTGPTGPLIVNGLLDRGFDVHLFHSGRHEVPLPAEVRHLHGDPHFPETIAEALGDREFDVALVQYGRLAHLARHLAGRVGHLMAIGGATISLAARDAPVWGGLGRPVSVSEERRLLETDAEANRLGAKVAEAMRSLFEFHGEGAFRATYIAYPILYGPRQPGAREWSIVRRLRDGRRRLILPDGGIKVESRGFTLNVAQAPLLAIDQPNVSAGRAYTVADEDTFSERQRATYMAELMGAGPELVDVPFDLARPMHAWYQHRRDSSVLPSSRIREELGYVDTIEPAEALRVTVSWLLERSAAEIDEIEEQLGDRFDYQAEDALMDQWLAAAGAIDVPQDAVEPYAHIYRHPRRPGEDWSRPTDARPPS